MPFCFFIAFFIFFIFLSIFDFLCLPIFYIHHDRGRLAPPCIDNTTLTYRHALTPNLLPAALRLIMRIAAARA